MSAEPTFDEPQPDAKGNVDRMLSPTLGPSTPYECRSLDDGVYPALQDTLTNSTFRDSYFGSSTQSLGRSHILRDCKAKTTGGWESKNVVHNDGTDRVFETMIVGEMRAKYTGTRMGSLGNHYVGPHPAKTTMGDGATARNVLMVGPPSRPSVALDAIWANQLAELNALTAEIAVGSGVREPQDVSSIIHNATNDEQHIKIVTEQIYTKPSKSAAPIRTHAKVDLGTLQEQGEPNVQPNESAGKAPEQAAEVPIALGAEYPLTKMPDHVGDYFKQRSSFVRQHDITDINGNLVPPWLLYVALKAGVLALFEGVFNIWCPPNRPVCLQFEAKRIKIIADSDSSPERPMLAPSLNSTSATASTATTNLGTKRSAALDAFGDRLNNKRAKTDDAPTTASSSSNTKAPPPSTKDVPPRTSELMEGVVSSATSPPLTPVSPETSGSERAAEEETVPRFRKRVLRG